jgi:hypothetical protein
MEPHLHEYQETAPLNIHSVMDCVHLDGISPSIWLRVQQDDTLYVAFRICDNVYGYQENMYYQMRFRILTVASMKFRVFWDVAPCNQVHHQGDDHVLLNR